jgi:hypothetical protein
MLLLAPLSPLFGRSTSSSSLTLTEDRSSDITVLPSFDQAKAEIELADCKKLADTHGYNIADKFDLKVRLTDTEVIGLALDLSQDDISSLSQRLAGLSDQSLYWATVAARFHTEVRVWTEEAQEGVLVQAARKQGAQRKPVGFMRLPTCRQLVPLISRQEGNQKGYSLQGSISLPLSEFFLFSFLRSCLRELV